MTKQNGFLISLAILGLSTMMLFSSCSYNLDGEKLRAMPEGREKDSLMFLRDHSVTYGTVLYAVKDTVYFMPKPEHQAKSTVVATFADVFTVVDRKNIDAGILYNTSITEDVILFEITDESGESRKAWLKADEMYGNLAPKVWAEKGTERSIRGIMAMGLVVSFWLMIFYFIGFRIYKYILIYIAVIAIAALFVLGGKSGALNQKMGRTVGYTSDGQAIRDDSVLGQNMVYPNPIKPS